LESRPPECSYKACVYDCLVIAEVGLCLQVAGQEILDDLAGILCGCTDEDVDALLVEDVDCALAHTPGDDVGGLLPAYPLGNDPRLMRWRRLHFDFSDLLVVYRKKVKFITVAKV